MFDTLKKKTVERLIEDALARENEELLYAQVVKEIEAGQRRDGLWAKALTVSAGDENRAKAEYIKLRVQSILDDQMLSALRHAEQKQRQKAAKAGADKQEEQDRNNRMRENQRKGREAKAREQQKRKKRMEDPVRNDWGNIT